MGCSTPHRFRSPCNKTVQYEIENRPRRQLLEMPSRVLDDLTVVPENTCPIERLVAASQARRRQPFSGLRDVSHTTKPQGIEKSPTSSFGSKDSPEGSVGVSNPLSAAFVTALTGVF